LPVTPKCLIASNISGNSVITSTLISLAQLFTDVAAIHWHSYSLTQLWVKQRMLKHLLSELGYQNAESQSTSIIFS